MNTRKPVFLLSVWMAALVVFAAFAPATPSLKGKEKALTVAFYNLENLFDTQDDPATNDADFLPNGKLKWDDARLKIKLKNMAKVIAQLGDPDGPEILGVAEVENEAVLKMLTAEPLLKKHGYGIVHHNSPDERGIDVAFLYKKKAFMPLYQQAYPVTLPSGDKTRDVLLVKGLIGKDHEIALIVNHWPSRRGGQEQSETARIAAAQVVRHVVDSIYSFDPFACVVIMGDFNDDPGDKSMQTILRASKDTLEARSTLLYNPMFAMFNRDSFGSLMYKGKWNFFDQIVVNKALISRESPVRYKPGSAGVYKPDWMQVQSGDYKGASLRTFVGDDFKDPGFSDHFPVYLQLVY